MWFHPEYILHLQRTLNRLLPCSSSLDTHFWVPIKILIQFKEDKPSEVFKTITRTPKILPPEINPSRHHNLGEITEIKGSSEIKAIHNARAIENSENGSDYEYIHSINEELEETRQLFIRRYENFTLLLLEDEIEYFNGADLQIDATFRDANQCGKFRQIWVIAKIFIKWRFKTYKLPECVCINGKQI